MVPKLSQHWQSWTSQPSDPQEFDAAFLEMMQWLRQHLSWLGLTADDNPPCIVGCPVDGLCCHMLVNSNSTGDKPLDDLAHRHPAGVHKSWTLWSHRCNEIVPSAKLACKRCQCPNKWVITQRGIESLQDKIESVQCAPDSIESWQCNIAKPRSNSTKLTRHAWGSICSNWDDSAPPIRDRLSSVLAAGHAWVLQYDGRALGWPSNASSKVYHSRKQRESSHLDMRCRSCFRHQGQWRKPRTVLALKRSSVNLLHKRFEQSCFLLVKRCLQARKGREYPSCLAKPLRFVGKKDHQHSF